jgi:hypothetical protein
LGWAVGAAVAVVPGLISVAILASTPEKEVRSYALCSAMGGPCDGKQWFLPQAAPIWLLQENQRYLYQPTESNFIATSYEYAGVTASADAPLPSVRGPGFRTDRIERAAPQS